MNRALMTLLPIVAGVLLDFLLGDPEWLYHPVRLIGNGISAMEKPLRRLFPQTSQGERGAGIALAVAVPTLTGFAVWGLSFMGAATGPWVLLAVETLLIYCLLAVKSLKVESMRVYNALKTGDIEAARTAVSRIVGRDTSELSEAQIIKATVETVAENTADGTVAPLFYVFLGGPILGWAYKAVNTLDSMVGYKNELYRDFGTASAKLDDLLGYLPARISALCMIAAANLLGLDAAGAMRVWKRDRRCHASPNSAQTESACAGALGLQLAGDSSYFGKAVHKPTIGDDLRPPKIEDIPTANRLMLGTTLVALGLFWMVKVAIFAAIW